jgi:hypothetical protein
MRQCALAAHVNTLNYETQVGDLPTRLAALATS